MRRYEIWIFRIEKLSEFLEKYSIFIKKKMRKRIKNANIYEWYAKLVFSKKNWGHKKKYSGIRDAKISCKSLL